MLRYTDSSVPTIACLLVVGWELRSFSFYNLCVFLRIYLRVYLMLMISAALLQESFSAFSLCLVSPIHYCLCGGTQSDVDNLSQQL